MSESSNARSSRWEKRWKGMFWRRRAISLELTSVAEVSPLATRHNQNTRQQRNCVSIGAHGGYYVCVQVVRSQAPVTADTGCHRLQGDAGTYISIPHHILLTFLPSTIMTAPAHVLDKYYLAITLLVTVGYQLSGFAIAWTLQASAEW